MKLILPLLVLAQAQGPSIDTYLTVRTPSAIAWSRDGSRLAIQLTNLDGSEVRIVDANGQNRVTVARSIAPGRYTVDRPDLVWSRDGQQLFYRAGAQYYMVPASGGSPRPLLTDTLPREVVQLAPDQSAVSFIRDGDIWVQSLSGGAPRKVSEGEKLLAALPDFFGRLQQWPRWSPDSRRIAFSSPWRPGSFSGSRVAVADVTSGTTRYVTPTDSTWAFTQVEWSPDSRSLAVSRLSSDYRVKELVVVADTGGAEWKVRRDSSDKWIAHNIEPSFSPAWSPDGKRLAFVSIASGWRQLYVADRSGGGTKQVTRGEFEVAAPSWSPDGRAILSVSTRDHPQAPRPLVIDPATGAAASLDTTLGSASDAWWPGYMTGPAWSPDSRRIAYALSSSADPYQVRTVTRTAAGYSTPASAHSALAEGLEPGVVMPLEAVSFPGKDGTTLRGVLYRARRSGTGPRPPALVHMYGGWGQLATMGWDIAFKSRLFQYLASRGYAVLVVDPRGSDGYGSAFAHGLYHDAAGKQSDDLAAAAGFLAGTGHADPERIALFGHSYGAFLTLATMLKTPGVFAAGVLQAGVFDFPLFIPLAVQYASMRFGTAATYEARGRPARHVDQLTAPVLVAHGTADFNAPHIGSEILVTELMRANKDFEFISYPGERHDWERPETARDFVRRVTAFLDRAMPARMTVGQAPSTRPVVVEGRNGMVVGTTGAPAVREGAKVLREGGTAVDAALTTALTQIALAAGSWVSYAGFMTLVHYDAATGKVEAMNAGFNTVRDETDPLTIPTMGNASGRTALVPGFMAGVEAAHRRFGRLPFARLFAPAIEVAERGIPVDAMVGGMIAQRRPVLSRLEETRRIFTKANGEFYAVGDQFVQKELAVTLRKVAAEGAAYMYRGPWAERLVALVRRDGGKMTLDDLASYKVIWGEPVRTTIREFEVYATGLPNVGGIATLEALNLIEAADLRNRPHYSTSADALYDLMQISRAPTTLGPAAMGGAPPELVAKYFPTLKPGSGALLSKDAARVAWGTISGPGWKAFDSTLRVVNASENSDVVEGILKSVRRPPSHSDAVVAVDSAGNMVALVHTINTVTWGTTGIFVDGISIPDAATFQQAAIKAVGPGNRVPEQTNPLLVLKSGRPYFASSSIGSGLFQTTVQSLHNVLDFGMHPQMAVDTAQFLKNEWLPKEAHILTAPPGAFRAALLDSVRARGQPVREVPPAGQGLLRGYWVGITRDAVTGMWRGGRSSGLNGSVEAY